MSSLLQDLNNFNFEQVEDDDSLPIIPEIPPRGESSKRASERKSNNSNVTASTSGNSPILNERKFSTAATSIANGSISVRTANSSATTLNRNLEISQKNNIPNNYMDSVRALVETLQKKKSIEEKDEVSEKIRKKFSSISISTSASDAFDSRLLELNVEEALVEASNFKMRSSEKIENLKLDLEKAVKNSVSFYGKLVSEDRVKEMTLNLHKLNSPGSQNKSLIEIDNANQKMDAIAAQLMDSTAIIISSERTILQHTCAVLKHEVISLKEQLKNSSLPNDKSALTLTQNKLISAESKITEQEKTINVLRGSLAKLDDLEVDLQNQKKINIELKAKLENRKEPTLAEHNKLKLDLAQMKAELNQIKEDFDAEKEKSFQLQSDIEDAENSVLNKDRQISTLQSELEMANNQLEMQDSGDSTFYKRKIAELEAQINEGFCTKNEDVETVRSDLGKQLKEAVIERERLRLQLESETEKLKALQASMGNGNMNTQTSVNQVVPESETDTEDEADGRSGFSIPKKIPLPRSKFNAVGSSNLNGNETILELKKKIENYEKDLNNLSIFQQELTETAPEKDFKFEKFKMFCKNLKKQKENLIIEVDNLKKKINDQEKIKKNISTLEKELEDEKLKIKKLEVDLGLANKVIETEKARHLNDELEFNSTIEKINSQLISIEKLHETELLDIKRNYETKAAEVKKITEALITDTKIKSEQLNKLTQDENENLKIELKKYKKEIEILTQQKKEETEKISNQEIKLQQLKNNIESLSNELDSIKSENKSLKTELENALSNEKNLNNIPQSINPSSEDKRNSAIFEMEKSLLDEIEKLQMTVVKLKTEKAVLMESKDNEEHHVQVLQQEISTLKNELVSLSKSLKELYSEQEKYEETILGLKNDIKKFSNVGNELTSSVSGEKLNTTKKSTGWG
ncbi:hypothetical protein HK099_001473, partial [Clydaea vesicula]